MRSEIKYRHEISKRDAELLYRRDINDVFIKVGHRVRVVQNAAWKLTPVSSYGEVLGATIFSVVGFKHPYLRVRYDGSDKEQSCIMLGAYLEVLPSSILASGEEQHGALLCEN